MRVFCSLGALGLALCLASPAFAQSSRDAATTLPASDAEQTPLTLLDAALTTMRRHPTILAARAGVGARAAEVTLASAPFDPKITASAGHTHDESPLLPQQRIVPDERELTTDTTSLTLGASLASLFGTTVTPSLSLQRVHQRPSPAVAGISADPVQQARVDLTVSQHLLRGAGTVGAASDLRAAERARTASEHTLAQTVQQQVYLTVLAYWQLVEAREELSLFRANEAAAKKVVDDTTSLVSSEQRPRSDLRQLEGNLANRRRAVFEAENAERQALYALRLAMGLGAEGGARYAPTEAFPEPQVPAGDGGELVRRAEGARRDVRAAREQVEAADARRRGAEWNTMPALDLTFSVGYAGALDRDGVDAYFTAVGQNVPGPNGMATLSLELPLQNAAARGDRDRKRADYETARFAAEDIERRLPTEVAGALDELRLSAAALGQSTAAVSQFELALQDERDKLHEGLGTVIDAVLTQELLIQAQLGASQNRLRYALALARLRLATGALPSGESEAESAVRAVLSLGGSGGN